MTNSELTLEKLKIVNLIACGSFGKVYLVKDEYNALYAMKKLNKKKIIMMRQVQHLQQEVTILKQIKCNFITKLMNVFQDEEHVYIVLEFVPGGELFYHLRRYEKFPIEVTRFYLAELSVAIGYLHEQGILYRDLKPENILLDKKGHIKLTDFGFAKQTTQLTFTMLGTPEYIAPELIKQTGHHKSADWWSFGVFAYELASGRPPFYDEDVNQLYTKILNNKLLFQQDFDSSLKDLIEKLLIVDKDKRLGAHFQTGTQDVRSHPFFKEVNWNWIEKRMVKPPIQPEVHENPLKFWESAQIEFVEDEEEMEEMIEAGGFAQIPNEEGIRNMFSWM